MLKVADIEMVECCQCKEWYHIHCVKVSQSALEDKNVVITVASNFDCIIMLPID